MTINGWIQIALFCAIALALTRPLGGYMTRVFTGERTLLSPVLRPVERVLYGAAGIDGAHEQSWLAYRELRPLIIHPVATLTGQGAALGLAGTF